MGRLSAEDAIQGVLARKGEHRVGRTKLMKCLYFLQQECGLDLGLSFELYTWGPFDAALLAEIESLRKRDLVWEDPPPADHREMGYDYTWTGPPLADVLEGEPGRTVDALLALNADVLEAMSTLHFASKQLNSKNAKVVERVKNLKPYFRLADLHRYWEQLAEWHWV